MDTKENYRRDSAIGFIVLAAILLLIGIVAVMGNLGYCQSLTPNATVPKVTPPTTAPSIFIEDIGDRITMLGHQEVLFGKDGKTGLQGDLQKTSAKLVKAIHEKTMSDCAASRWKSQPCIDLAVKFSGLAMDATQLQEQIQIEALAELTDADKIAAKHRWNAQFNYQTQQFEAQPKP